MARHTCRLMSSKAQAGNHVGQAIAFHVLHCGAELAVHVARAIEHGNVRAVEGLRALRFLQDKLDEDAGQVGRQVQVDCLERNGPPGTRVIGFVHCARRRFSQLTYDFETADFCGHRNLPAKTPLT